MNLRSAILGLITFLLAWKLAALAVNINILPQPEDVVAVVIREFPKSLGYHTSVSALRIGIGLLGASALAVPLGLLLGQSRTLSRFIMPLVYITYPIPKVVLLPIIILFLGIGDAGKIFLIALIVFYQMLLVIRDAAAVIRAELVYSVRSLGASRIDLLRYVYLPACLPATLTALRLSLGTAIAVLYLAESFATRAGLGYFIQDAWGQLAYKELYAGVLTMTLLGLIVYFSLELLEHKLCPWVHAGT